MEVINFIARKHLMRVSGGSANGSNKLYGKETSNEGF